LAGRLHYRDFLHSLRNYHAEAVFTYEDPVPGLVECALLPYLSVKRGF
jgi:predicted ATP-grasp superfamily ATP-dependent carboligase